MLARVWYKAAPKTELSAENRVVVSMGGTVAPTPAPDGIAGTGVTTLVDVTVHDNSAPPPPPETWDAYTKKGEEHTGVTEMINMLRNDLNKEIQETEVNEKEGQADLHAGPGKPSVIIENVVLTFCLENRV